MDERPPRHGEKASTLEALAAAARNGQPERFEELAMLISGRLQAFSRRALRNRALAEDAAQEALLRIFLSLPRYRTDNFVAWALTITARVCHELERRERRQARLAQSFRRLQEPSTPPLWMGELEEAVAGLPDDLRVTFLLRQQGMAYTEIAAALAIPIGTVRSRLHQARRLLRRALAPPTDEVDRA